MTGQLIKQPFFNKNNSIICIFDGAIYNAAVTSEALLNSGNRFPTFEDYPLNLWQKAIDINLTGAFLFAREIGKQFKLGKAGSLINISSIYGVVGPDHRIYEGQTFSSFPAYSASKAGIIGLSKWLATWWAKDNIRVNCVTPGGVYNNHNDTFTNAYGNNMAEDGGVFMLFSGDINQDGSVDFNDYPNLDLASSSGVLGYDPNDLNGDASVDFNDYPLIDVNSSNGIISSLPY